MSFLEKYKQQKNDLPACLVQAGKFVIVGLINTALDFSVYFLLTRLIGFIGAHPAFAKGISFSVGVLNSFIWNRKWTFQSKTSPWITIGPFVLVSLVGLLINTGILQLLFTRYGWNEILVLVIATIATITWNFIINRFLVFRK